jgi:hypothetical protein
MKFFFVLFILSLSFQALSQSFVIMENGIILTTDRFGYMYDFGHYTYPQRISLKGGQYFVEEDNILVTIDENGFLYRKYEAIPQNILGKGINYFISKDGFLFSIDNKGALKVSEAVEFKNAKNFGGHYFTTESNEGEDLLDLYVVLQDGSVQKAQLKPFEKKEIVSYGGNYFMTNRGFLYTVSKDGEVINNERARVGLLTKKGGNYFVDSSNLFYTVTDEGILKMPDLPSSLRISSILKLGTNYFIDQMGKLFIVDRDGVVSEKVMIDYDFKLAKIISL